jgi:hypothetical protein
MQYLYKPACRQLGAALFRSQFTYIWKSYHCRTYRKTLSFHLKRTEIWIYLYNIMPAREEMNLTAAISVVCHSVAGYQHVWSEIVCTFHNCYRLLFLHFEISLISFCLIVDKTSWPFLQFTTHWSSYLRRHITCTFDNVVQWVILICVFGIYVKISYK